MRLVDAFVRRPAAAVGWLLSSLGLTSTRGGAPRAKNNKGKCNPDDEVTRAEVGASTRSRPENIGSPELNDRENSSGEESDAIVERAAGSSGEASPSGQTELNIQPAVPWGDLPEACVERILLGAGFQATLCATSACKSWRRVTSNQNFWRKMFVVYFGRKETDAEEARMRARRRRYEYGEVTIDVPLTHPGRPWDWHWRGSFRAAVATEWRWVAGRCERARCLTMDDGVMNDPGMNDQGLHPGNTVGVALHNGRGFTASGDGRCRCWDAKTGDTVATYPSHDQRRPESSRDAPNPVICMSHKDGIVAVGHARNGLVRGFNLDTGVETFRRECGGDVETRVTSVAVGGGWIVAGTDGGAVVAVSAADGSDVVAAPSTDLSTSRYRANPAPRFERGVSAVVVDPSGTFASAAAGADVVTWTVCAPDAASSDDGGSLDELKLRRRSFSDGLVHMRGHAETVRCMAYAPRPADQTCIHDGSCSAAPFLVTGGDDATLRIWDPSSGRCLRELEGPPGTAEAEHAGQTPVEWQYSPPPGVTALDVWAGQIVEGRDDGSVLHWSGAFDGLRFDHELSMDDDGSHSMPGSQKGQRSSPSRGRSRHRPSAYRRWWVHAERVTAVLARGGRVVSVGGDGECHVMALPEDALRRARATLAAEGRREADAGVMKDADVDAASEGAEGLGSPPNDPRGRNSQRKSQNDSSIGAYPGGIHGYQRRLSSEFMNVAARCAHTAWRGGRGAASAVARSTNGLARRTEAAGMRLLESADALSGGAASAAASQAAAASAAARSAAAFAAAEAERVAVELSHLAIGQLYSGGEFRAVGGVRFREHKASIGCVAADREMLVTGDEDGNVFVRDFEPAHLGQ